MAAMQDEGLPQADIATLAGVNRSQVNRWARGENRPTYDKALRLARQVGARMPELAAQFMEASGYSWDGVASAPQPEPELDPDLLEKIRQTIPPDDQQRVIDAILATMRGTPPNGPTSGSAEADRGRRAV